MVSKTTDRGQGRLLSQLKLDLMTQVRTSSAKKSRLYKTAQDLKLTRLIFEKALRRCRACPP